MKQKIFWQQWLIIFIIVIVIIGTVKLLVFPDSSAAEQSGGEFNASFSASAPEDSIPWTMFRGNYFHTGFANVSGPAEANLKWKIKTGSGNAGAPPPNSVIIGSNGVIYVGSDEGITALNPDGSELWKEDYNSVQGPALSNDEKVIYFAGQSFIGALNSVNGAEIWEFQVGSDALFGPTIGSDGTIYQGSWDHYFYAINPNGTLKWKYETSGCVSYPASIDSSGFIYLGGGDAHCGEDGKVYSFTPSGELRWTYDTGVMRVGTPVISGDGNIILAAAPYLIVLFPDGTLDWKLGPSDSGAGSGQSCGLPPLPPCQGGVMPELSGIISPVIGPDGMIYAGNSAGLISAVNPSTREVEWDYSTSGVGLPSFPVADKDGTIYFGSINGNMYAVDNAGVLKWVYETGGGISEASPAMGSDGTLYFTSNDGYLYSLQ